MRIRKRRKPKMLQPVSWTLESPWRTGNLRMEKKRKVRYGIFHSSSHLGQVEKWLVLVNGRNEYIEKYGYLPFDLNLPANWGLLTWDHQGQGDSTGQRGHIDSFMDYVRDARAVIETVLPANADYDIVSHSMGALISASGIISGQLSTKKFAMISPFFGVPNDTLPVTVSRVLSSTMATFRLGRVYVNGSGLMPNRDFCDNDKTYNRERYLQQALSPYRSSQITFGWLQAAFDALKQVHDEARLQRFANIPCLILQASEETVVDVAAIENWAKLVREQGAEVTSYTLSPAKHELLSERETIYDQVIRLLQDHFELEG